MPWRSRHRSTLPEGDGDWSGWPACRAHSNVAGYVHGASGSLKMGRKCKTSGRACRGHQQMRWGSNVMGDGQVETLIRQLIATAILTVAANLAQWLGHPDMPMAPPTIQGVRETPSGFMGGRMSPFTASLLSVCGTAALALVTPLHAAQSLRGRRLLPTEVHGAPTLLLLQTLSRVEQPGETVPPHKVLDDGRRVMNVPMSGCGNGCLAGWSRT